MELLNYLLKVSACLALFFAFYLLVLRKLTFFKINRFYLLLSLVISFIIPALQFTIEREMEALTEVAVSPIARDSQIVSNVVLLSQIEVKSLRVTGTGDFNWLNVFPIAYGLVAFTLLLMAIRRLFQLFRQAKAYKTKVNGLNVISKNTGFTNCSFFNYVFIDENSLSEKELAVLLAHEQVHSIQYHSVDKLMMIIAKALLWFNPIIYLYDKALAQAHEYEADETTSLKVGTEHYAALLLQLAVRKSSNPLIHNFVKSPIKQRIKMLFNSKSKNMKKLSYLLVLPISLGLIWGFTIDVKTVFQEREFTLVIDAGHGGNQKGVVVNGVSEKEITLSMSRKLKAIAEENGINVITTRNSDTDLSLQNRIKTNGSFLISLHINSEPKTGLLNGIEMFTSTSLDEIKMGRSMGMTYSLYQSLKNMDGIAVSNRPKQKRMYILENTTMPGVILELGYLTNKKDFRFITNEQKQNELAKAIIDGVLSFKKTNKTDVEMKAIIENSKQLSDRLLAWKNSDKYKSIIAKAAKFKPQTVKGKIESLHYFSVRSILDGFILNANGERYRIYLTKEQLIQYNLVIGDEIIMKVKRAEVWQDSDYPVLYTNEILSINKASNIRKTYGRSSVKVVWRAKENSKNFEYSAQDSMITDKEMVYLYGKARLKTNNKEIFGDQIHYNSKTKKSFVFGL